MECTGSPHVTDDLASTRRGAAVFLETLDHGGAQDRLNWSEKWETIGDTHQLRCELNIKQEAFEKAIEAWLCALTAFEVARRLLDEEDSRTEDISVKIESSIQKFGQCLTHKLERVEIACCNEAEFPAYYLPAGDLDSCAPAVICISSEGETGAAMLARLLPVTISRGVSVLAISHKFVHRLNRRSEMLLSCCLDYLSMRPDVDATRIGVYGEGVSAVLATDFAASDDRVAAAVCDGGLWNWTRTLASIGWLTKSAVIVDEDLDSARHSRMVRQLGCPVLVVAGGRSMVSASEAIKLEADCLTARIDLSVALPRVIWKSGGIENFVLSDDCIFAWLEHRLAHSVQFDSCYRPGKQ